MPSCPQLRTSQCPCCNKHPEYEGFQQLLELRNIRFLIYSINTHTENVSKKGPTQTDILHKTKNTKPTAAEVLPILDINQIPCPRCKQKLKHAQDVLDKAPDINIDKLEICDHCRSKAQPQSYKPCNECDKIIKKAKDYIKFWLSNKSQILKRYDYKDTSHYDGIRSYSETDMNLFKKRQPNDQLKYSENQEESQSKKLGIKDGEDNSKQIGQSRETKKVTGKISFKLSKEVRTHEDSKQKQSLNKDSKDLSSGKQSPARDKAKVNEDENKKGTLTDSKQKQSLNKDSKERLKDENNLSSNKQSPARDKAKVNADENKKGTLTDSKQKQSPHKDSKERLKDENNLSSSKQSPARDKVNADENKKGTLTDVGEKRKDMVADLKTKESPAQLAKEKADDLKKQKELSKEQEIKDLTDKNERNLTNQKKTEKELATKEKKVDEKDVANQKEKDLANQKEKDLANQKEKDLANQKEKDLANQKEKDLANQKEKDLAKQKEKDLTNQKEKDLANQKEKDLANQKEKDLANQKEKDLAKQKEKDLANQKEKDLAIKSEKQSLIKDKLNEIDADTKIKAGKDKVKTDESKNGTKTDVQAKKKATQAQEAKGEADDLNELKELETKGKTTKDNKKKTPVSDKLPIDTTVDNKKHTEKETRGKESRSEDDSELDDVEKQLVQNKNKLADTEFMAQLAKVKAEEKTKHMAILLEKKLRDLAGGRLNDVMEEISHVKKKQVRKSKHKIKEERKPLPKIKPDDIIIGEHMARYQPPFKPQQEVNEEQIIPMVFQKRLNTAPIQSPIPESLEKVPEKSTKEDPDSTKGIMHYALSDRTFIDKGWTMLPTEKVVRKMNVYRMRPAHPEFDWFERNKSKRLMNYDTGEKLAEFDDNGRGRWFYRNGRLALDYYDAEEINAQQRFVLYSSGEPDERGRSHPITILATFDYLGNGIVFDHAGKIRLKYNQTEGVVLDRLIGPVSHWKWHTLNDPPVLQQVMLDCKLSRKDPVILKMSESQKSKGPQRTQENEDMLAIEFDNFIKEKNEKLTQKFKPFQIKMKALKINEHFSLRVLDQASVYLIFRDGSTNIKLNIGMVLDHREIVDTDTAEVGEVANSMERLPARTDSLAALQRSIAFAQHYERTLTERERRTRPTMPCSSADKLVAPASRPLRPPFRTTSLAPSGSTSNAGNCKCRKPISNLYYDTRLM